MSTTALILSAILACTSPDPAVSPDGFGQAVGDRGETNGTGYTTVVCISPDPAISPDGFGQAVGERGETNGSNFAG